MRTIHIPPPGDTARLIVRKRRDQHMTADQLVRGRRGSASDVFGKAVIKVARDSVGADAQTAETPWSVLWITHRAGPWYGFEREEEVEFALDGPDGGIRLRDRLHDAFMEEPVDVVAVPPAAGLPADAFPAAARWGRFTFGPRLGEFSGRCVIDPGCEGVEPQSTPALLCPTCGQVGVPQWEMVGYPTPGLEALIKALDEIGICDLVLAGCLMPERPRGPAVCEHCDQDLFRASEEPQEIADRVFDADDPAVESGFNRLYVAPDQPGTAIFVGSAKPRWGTVAFPLSLSTLRELGATECGLLALRAEGGAVVFADIEDVIAVMKPRERGRPRLRVPVLEPVGQGARIDGRRVAVRLLPWRTEEAGPS